MDAKARAWLEYVVTRGVAFCTDSALMAAAYAAAFALRLDFQAPAFGWRMAAWSFVVVWLVQFVAFFACGCHRMAWRRTTLAQASRFALAFMAAAAVLTLLRVCLPSGEMLFLRPPYSVTLIDAILAPLVCLTARFLWKWWIESRVDEKRLLNRDERRADVSRVVPFFTGKCVFVTGAGGSIGSELVRQTLACAPRKIVLVERGENALYEIDREVRALAPSAEIVPALVDVADETRMAALFAAHKPEIVLHAAAYKHVPMVECNPREGLRNNALATRRLGELAREAAVERFVLISTDKAVHPAGVMGFTKRLAEILLLDLNGPASPTAFSAVRFGNVLGSSGSVVPLFREQIARGGPVTVTHPDMKRYFMSIGEAVSLVMQAAALDGDLFTLDMGEPVKILALAEEMIRQAGFRPYVDVPIRFTGVRPGEKMFEELDVSEKSFVKTGCARVYVTKTEPPNIKPAELHERLRAIAAQTDETRVDADLRELKVVSG